MKKGLILTALVLVLGLTSLFSAWSTETPIPDTLSIKNDATDAPPATTSTSLDTVTINLDNGKQVKIYKSNVPYHFEYKKNKWQLKQGAYDLQTDTWTIKSTDNSNGKQLKYSPDGQRILNFDSTNNKIGYYTLNNQNSWDLVYISSTSQFTAEDFAKVKVKNVNGKTVVEYADGSASVDAQVIPSAIVKQAGGADFIDVTQVTPLAIGTIGGGTITWEEKSGMTLISQKTPASEGKAETTATTLTLPNGQTLEGTDAVTDIAGLKDKILSLEGKEYTVSEASGTTIKLAGKKGTPSAEETVSIVSDTTQSTLTVTEEKGKTTTTLQYQLKDGQVASQTTKVEKDGKLETETVTNFEIKDAKSTVKETGTAIFENGEKQYTKYTDQKSGAVSYEFKKKEADNVYVRVHVSSDGEKVCVGTCFNDDGDPIEKNFYSIDSIIKGNIDGYQSDDLQKKAKIAADARQSELSWMGVAGWGKALSVTEQVLGSIKNYRGFSDLIGIPDSARPMNWLGLSDQAFASIMLEKYFVSAICDTPQDVAPKGTAYIETSSGSHQAVAHIEMERSLQEIYVLCDETRPCTEEGYSCSNEGFCQKEKETLKAYFYKITWGVTAPSDEALTTSIDEKGNAVSFNIKVGDNWLYEKDGISKKDTIKLQRGGHDGDAMVYYSLNPSISEACILWDAPPKTLSTDFGGGIDEIGDVCNDVIISTAGSINYEASGGEGSSSSTVSSGEVTPVTGFLN